MAIEIKMDNGLKKKNKYKSMPLAGRAAVWFTISNFILKGVGLITMPLYTRLIIPKEYGHLTELNAVEEILLILSNWDIYTGAYLRGLFKYENTKFFTAVSQFFANIATICLYSICLLLFIMFKGSFGFSFIAFLFMFLQHMVYPSYRFWLVRQQCDFAYKPATIVTLSYGLLTGLVPLLAIMTIEKTAEVKFCSAMAISIAFCMPFYIKNCQYVSILKHKLQFFDKIKFILRYQIPFLISSLSLVLMTQLDRIVISQMIGHEQTAYYSVACSITSGLTIFYSSIGQVMLPWKYKKLKEGKYDYIRIIETRLIIVLSSVVLIFINIAPEIIKILFQDTYYEAVWCIPPLAIGIFLNYLSSLFSSVETYYERTKYSAFGLMFCSGMNIALNVLLINSFGYSVCAYTTAVSYLLYAVMHSFFVRKTIQQVKIQANMYNAKCIILTCMILLSFTFMDMWLYPYAQIRYGITCVLLIIFFIKRKWLKGLVGVIRSRNV